MPFKKTLTTLLVLLCSSALYADDFPGKRWRLSLLASELSEPKSSHPWAEAHAGIGIAVAYAISPKWDVELSAASQSYRSAYTEFHTSTLPGGPNITYPATSYREYRVVPINVMATRRFNEGGLVAPYFSGGVRFVGAPRDKAKQQEIPNPNPSSPFIPARAGFGFSDRTSAQAAAGVNVRITANTALRAELTQLLRMDEAEFDALTRGAVGVSWNF